MFTVLEREEFPGGMAEILEIQDPRGSSDIHSAEQLFFARQMGLRPKLLRFTLEDTKIILPRDQYSHSEGLLSLEQSALNLLELSGQGEVYLKPRFGDVLFHRMNAASPGLVTSLNTFAGITRGLEISPFPGSQDKKYMRLQKLFLKKDTQGETEVKIQGEGLCILSLPISRNEIQRISLKGERSIIGEAPVILREEGIEEIHIKGKERRKVRGRLQEYSGTGDLWIVPMVNVYQKMKNGRSLGMGAYLANREYRRPAPGRSRV